MNATGRYQVTLTMRGDALARYDGDNYADALSVYTRDVCAHTGDVELSAGYFILGSYVSGTGATETPPPANESDAGAQIFRAQFARFKSYGNNAWDAEKFALREMAQEAWTLVSRPLMKFARAPRRDRDLADGDEFELWINQAWRACEVIATDGDRALVVYAMPNGRQYLLELPTAARFIGRSDCRTTLRNVSAAKPPARWRAAVAEYQPQQDSDENIERAERAARRAQSNNGSK